VLDGRETSEGRLQSVGTRIQAGESELPLSISDLHAAGPDPFQLDGDTRERIPLTVDHLAEDVSSLGLPKGGAGREESQDRNDCKESTCHVC